MSEYTISPEWDKYWSEKNTISNRIYDMIAVAYRTVIISPCLRKYLRAHFKEGDNLLHAGCGGGGVEESKSPYNILALDISKNALTEYKQHHKIKEIIQGTITNLSLKDGTFDGIYNLGVMEHFSDEEIHDILTEFSRVVKKNGTVILFWAHNSGVTVIFLRYLHYILNVILRRDIQLHPAEPSLYISEEWLKERLKTTNFKIAHIDFNISNLYTYMVVVLQKE
jgi:ubiquinone/menaquinone biosynthesis C-methylase UbiE